MTRRFWKVIICLFIVVISDKEFINEPHIWIHLRRDNRGLVFKHVLVEMTSLSPFVQVNLSFPSLLLLLTEMKQLQNAVSKNLNDSTTTIHIYTTHTYIILSTKILHLFLAKRNINKKIYFLSGSDIKYHPYVSSGLDRDISRGAGWEKENKGLLCKLGYATACHVLHKKSRWFSSLIDWVFQ